MESHAHVPQPVPSLSSRRSFLGVLLGLASAFVGALLAVPVLRYIFYPLTTGSEESDWAVAGPVATLGLVQTPQRLTLDIKQRDGWRKMARQQVVYILNAGGKLKAVSAICPHLGCTVPWDPGRNEFVCPCHGGTFSADGARLSGPPRRSLDALETRESGGTLMVKCQYFRPDVASKEASG